jgi:hypothetical protein
MSRYASSAAWVVAALIWPLTYVATAATQTGSAKATEGVIRRYMIVHGDSMSGSWEQDDTSSNEGLRARFGDRVAWFRKDGHEYVVTDSAVMNELDVAMEPQKNVNRMQSGVNQRNRDAIEFCHPERRAGGWAGVKDQAWRVEQGLRATTPGAMI